jgi:hypothetical protein
MTTWLRLGDPEPLLRQPSIFSKNRPHFLGIPDGEKSPATDASEGSCTTGGPVASTSDPPLSKPKLSSRTMLVNRVVRAARYDGNAAAAEVIPPKTTDCPCSTSLPGSGWSFRMGERNYLAEV